MGRKSKVSFILKLEAVIDYLNGKRSMSQIARELEVDNSCVLQWTSLYESLGESGLVTPHKNTCYSKELKINAVRDYLSGYGSQLDVCKKYGIRSTGQLRDWIMKYNSHKKIKPSRTGGNHMTKGRTTTFNERIEIVKYCIEHDRDYNNTSEKFQVSYQQVRNWVIKYDESGVDALVDRRGKSKPQDQLTELEKLRAQNKILEARNKRLEMENEVLKKLEALERR